MEKRNIFEEMMHGIDDMAAEREGKISLSQFEVNSLSDAAVSADESSMLQKATRAIACLRQRDLYYQHSNINTPGGSDIQTECSGCDASPDDNFVPGPDQ